MEIKLQSNFYDFCVLKKISPPATSGTVEHNQTDTDVSDSESNISESESDLDELDSDCAIMVRDTCDVINNLS